MVDDVRLSMKELALMKTYADAVTREELYRAFSLFRRASNVYVFPNVHYGHSERVRPRLTPEKKAKSFALFKRISD